MNPICKGDFTKRNGEHVPPHEPVEMHKAGSTASGYNIKQVWGCRVCRRRTPAPDKRP